MLLYAMSRASNNNFYESGRQSRPGLQHKQLAYLPFTLSCHRLNAKLTLTHISIFHTYSVRCQGSRGFHGGIGKPKSLPQLQLSEEAEKWAASYRSQIPMQTDPQMARRVMDADELSRYVQTESGDVLRARSASEEGRDAGGVSRAHYSSVSDGEEDDEDEDHSEGALLSSCLPRTSKSMSSTGNNNYCPCARTPGPLSCMLQSDRLDVSHGAFSREKVLQASGSPGTNMKDVADNEAAPAQQQEPLAHITNALLHGVSPNDYTSRVEDSLAVLGQALRANGAVLRGNGARTVGVQVNLAGRAFGTVRSSNHGRSGTVLRVTCPAKDAVS